MRIFVYEFVTGGGLQGKTLGSRLIREGRLMADRLVEDITALPHAEVLVARDPRIPHTFPSRVRVMSNDLPSALSRGLAAADAVWLVAPESSGVLTRLTREAEASGCRLLSSAADAVELAGSKWRTLRLLEARGIPVVPATRPGQTLPPHAGYWIVKPDDGVGCEGIRIMTSREQLCRCLLAAEASDSIVQPLLDGDALSLSLLCLGGQARLLTVNRQIVKPRDGGLSFEGCDVNIPAVSMRAALVEIADRTAAAIPGLRGIVGIDLLWTAEGPRVLEINPRLTTSYAGLHEALDINPAALVLDLHNGLPVIPPSCGRTVAVRLQPESEVSHG